MMRHEISEHYNLRVESTRLDSGAGLLERLRTLEILHRHLPAAPAVVLDVGGATGVYALPLAAEGYTVHLIDPMPLHVEQALDASARAARPLASATQGDAAKLQFADRSADAVLLLGPLYHLTERSERLMALGEARRCLKPGGVVFAAAISRFASLMDGLSRGLIEDPAFVPMMRRDLVDGQHRNATDRPDYFTTAFFHHPDELLGEMSEAGFAGVQVLGVEGPVWRAPRLEAYMTDAGMRELVVDLARAVESEPSIMGASAHLLAVGRRIP